MPPLSREAYEDVTPFGALLPHGLLVDPETGVLLLSTPRWGRSGLALGCAWTLLAVMPACGAFTGGLNVLDDAFQPLFGNGGMGVWMLGHKGLYPVATRLLRAD